MGESLITTCTGCCPAPVPPLRGEPPPAFPAAAPDEGKQKIKT